jgi:fucose permease
VALCAATVLAVGVELGSIGILTTYLAELRGFSQTTSKIGLIVFLTGMASGRLFLGFFAQKGKIPQLILALLGLSCMFFAGLFLLDLGRLTYAAILLAGASLSALLPLMITLSGMLHPEATGMVLAFIKVAAGLGGILLPFCMSLIVKAVSFQASLLLFPAVLLLAFCVLFLQLRRIGPVEPVSIPRPVD